MHRIITLLAAGWLLSGLAGANPDAPVVEGDYLEARTCNIVVGPCHFNAEVLDRGREATLAWHIREGAWQGVELAGLTAVAVVTADRNLQDLGAAAPARQTVLYLDEAASPRQREALRAFVAAAYGAALGRVVATAPASIRFHNQDEVVYRLQVGDVLSLEAARSLCDHCTQTPYQVWYSPLVQGVEVETGKSTLYRYHDRFLSSRWELGEENSVFAGTFQVASR